MRPRAAILALALLWAVRGQAAPPTDAPAKAKAIAGLRGEIGTLEAELVAERARATAEAQSLAQRIAQAQAQLAATQAHVRTHQDAVAQAEASDTARAAAQARLRDAVGVGVTVLGGAIDSSLPYRQAERRAALTRLADDLAGRRLAPAEAAARLWRLAEDELRLTGELARTATPVTLSAGGDPQLVEVVKLGMVVLLTRQPDGALGWLRRVGDAWRHDPLPAGADPDEVRRLFADLDKGVRGGLYRLPVPGVGGPK